MHGLRRTVDAARLARSGEENCADAGGFAPTLTGGRSYALPDDTTGTTAWPGSRTPSRVRCGRCPRGRWPGAGSPRSPRKGFAEPWPTSASPRSSARAPESARDYIRVGCRNRVAGPKEGLHAPFSRRVEIEPGEVFAIAGPHAEGMSTLLSAVRSGVADHIPCDRRERMATVHNPAFVEAGAHQHHRADLSLFFESLHSSLAENPCEASDLGSGSTSVAADIGRATARAAPLPAFDAGRSPGTLLVPSRSRP